MSLLSTLAKVAVGVAVAKGVGGMAKGGTTRSSRGAGTGSIFGGANSSGGGSLGDLLAGAAGGAGGLGGLLKGVTGGSSGGLGGLTDLLTGGSSSSAGGLGGLGKILSGAGGSTGGLGGLLEGLSQASSPSQAKVAPPTGGSLGDLLNQSLDNFGEPAVAPQPAQEESAKVLLSAMLQAAKSDGRIDAEEKKNLLGKLGDISASENEFISEQLAKPVDAAALAASTPRGMESQVYMMSLLAIDLDSKEEANYLHQLAQGLNIEPNEANSIHEKMGEPKLYS